MIHKDERMLSAAKFEQFQKAVSQQEFFPEQVLLHHLMMAYENTMQDDLPSAMEEINQAEQSLVDIKQQGILKHVERVLQYLFIGTKCHVLNKLEQLREIHELSEEICDVKDMNELELAMLNGCRCSILTMFNNTPVPVRIDCAKRAIRYDPSNGKWYYLLGEVYRYFRRDTDLSQKPDDRETFAFEKAYKLFPNDLFGTTLAQMYRESGNLDKAVKIYKEICALQPTSCSVRFQLALGFIRACEFALAKECLDYIAEKIPDSTRYMHYMGIYEEKGNKDLMAALPYYKSATELGNFPAEWHYVLCRKSVESDWDPLPYMLDLLEKYNGHHSYITQEIIIQIGLYYIFEKDDVLSACPHLRRAIELDPAAKALRNSSPVFDRSHRVNVFDVLEGEVQFALRNDTTMYDDKTAVLKSMLAFCRECKDLAPSSAFPRAQPSGSRFSNSHRNYDRGSSSRVQVNWREEKSDNSSPPGFSQNCLPRRSNDGFNSPKRYSGSSRERDYTSWRSDERKTQDSQNVRQSSNTFDNKRDSASIRRIEGKDVQQTLFSQQRNRNTGTGNHETCSLVKNVKDLNL